MRGFSGGVAKAHSLIRQYVRKKEQRTIVMTTTPATTDDPIDTPFGSPGENRVRVEVPRPPTDTRRVQRHRLFVASIVTAISIAAGLALVAIALNISEAGTGSPESLTSVAAATDPSAFVDAPDVVETTAVSSPTGFAIVDVSGLVEYTVDTVVTIDVTTSVRIGPRQVESSGSGSGVIMSSDGLIVTNAHVVADAETVDVVLTDGLTHPATVVSYNESVDLALLQIEATD